MNSSMGKMLSREITEAESGSYRSPDSTCYIILSHQVCPYFFLWFHLIFKEVIHFLRSEFLVYCIVLFVFPLFFYFLFLELCRPLHTVQKTVSKVQGPNIVSSPRTMQLLCFITPSLSSSVWSQRQLQSKREIMK